MELSNSVPPLTVGTISPEPDPYFRIQLAECRTRFACSLTFMMATWPVESGAQNAGPFPPELTSSSSVSPPPGAAAYDCSNPSGPTSFTALSTRQLAQNAQRVQRRTR